MVSTTGLAMATDKNDVVSLNCLLFFFFGGLGCLVPGLALAGHAVGLHQDELYLVSMVAPCVALLGPLLAGPLADRLGAPSQGSAARYGRYLRSMLVLSAVLGAVLYTALLYVPLVSRRHERNPPVIFSCSAAGAKVLQDQCQEVPCYNWPEENRGALFLSGCHHVCGDDPDSANDFFSTTPPIEKNSVGEANKDNITSLSLTLGDPRLCFEHHGQTVCHVYTNFSRQLPINVSLAPSEPPTDPSQWCNYKILDKIACKQWGQDNCSVVCDLDDPYNDSRSLLLNSECRHTLGDPQLTFWSFLVLRSVADIFPTTAIALIAACLVVAARDTPALLCRHLIFAVLGYTTFPPLVELGVSLLPEDPITDKHVVPYGYHIITFAFLSIVSAIILLFARSLPLSPVDYHLHLGPSQLSLRGAGGEIGALSLVLVLLGLLSSAIDSYIPWESVLLALIPCLPVLWYSWSIVDYCGHSNILIAAFTFYIIRYTGLLIWEDVLVLFLLAVLEVFTLVLSWATAVLYLRHLVPRHFLVTGQAVAVIMFFCIGRSLGSVIGGLLVVQINDAEVPKWNDYYSEVLYKTGALLSAFIASLYFILYHFCLKHRWRKQNARVTKPVVQDTNANGTYTPLKIYNPTSKDERIRY